MAVKAPAQGSPTTTSPDDPRIPAAAAPRRRRAADDSRAPRWSPGASLVACVLCSPLLLINAQVAADAAGPSPRAAAATAATPTGSLLLLQPRALQALPRAAPRARGDYDDEYDDEGDDYDDDYDYYGTRKKKKKKKPTAAPAAAAPIQLNEMFNFVRVFVLRMVWGIASMFGLDEPLSEAFNGAFVPPGVEVDDDGLGFDY